MKNQKPHQNSQFQKKPKVHHLQISFIYEFWSKEVIYAIHNDPNMLIITIQSYNRYSR